MMLEQLDLFQWWALLLCSFLIGVNKTGVPGIGILVAPFMAAVFPAKISTGLVLPMLMVGDLVAVAYYKQHAVWGHLVRLLPWVVGGVVIGWFIMGRVNDAQLQLIIALIILVILGLTAWRSTRRQVGTDRVGATWWFPAGMGLLAGVCTMLSNAAGPIMTIYLLVMGHKKQAFMGTGAWFYLIINTLKVPFSAQLGLLTADSLKLSLAYAPVIVLGALAGITLLKVVSEKWFRVTVEILAASVAVRLLLQVNWGAL